LATSAKLEAAQGNAPCPIAGYDPGGLTQRVSLSEAAFELLQ